MTKETEEKNSATSPYACNPVLAILRAADQDSERANRYELPEEVSGACEDPAVTSFSALTIAGNASTKLKRLSDGKSLKLIDGGVSHSMLQRLLERASSEWNEITGHECPVTMDDLTCQNQTAAAIVCCSASWRTGWKKKKAKFMGKTVWNGTSLQARAFETSSGMAAFVAPLNDHTYLVVIENTESELGNAISIAGYGREREVIIPSFCIEAKNDFWSRYPEYFKRDCLKFSEDGPLSRLASFKENIFFSLNEKGVFGVSVVTMKTACAGIFIPQEPSDDAIFIDEPFRAFVVSKLVDGTDAVIFDVVVNTVK